MIKIVESPYSNWKSVYFCIKKLGFKVESITIKSIPNQNNFSIIILPGVGHMSSFVKEIEKYIKVESLRNLIFEKKFKVIGICLGFQFLCNRTEEEPNVKCLEILDFDVTSINKPVCPSVGWRKIEINKMSKDCKELNFLENRFFYFTHSYHAEPKKNFKKNITVYSYKNEFDKEITALVIKENIIGLQFHPEKSSKAGQLLLQNLLSDLIN
jgi:glutamine amidotransferase